MDRIYEDDNFRWSLGGGEAKLLKYIGDATRVSIPDDVCGCAVTSIGERAFYGSWSLFEVTLPETLKTIEEAAFLACGTLKELTLPEGLESIGKDAVQGTGVEKLLLPASLKDLGPGALYGIRVVEAAPGNPVFYTVGRTLTEKLGDGTTAIIRYSGFDYSYDVPEGCSRIAQGAFRGAAIRSVTLPASLEMIEPEAFIKCDDLKTVGFPVGDGKYITVKFPLISLNTAQNTWLVSCLRSTPESPYIDADAYDALILDLPLSLEKLDIATDRLKSGWLLSPSHERGYLEFLGEHADRAMAEAIRKNDLVKLNDLAELGVFNGDNIDTLIDMAADAPEFLSYLLNYKIDNIGISETDYEL